MSHRTHRRVVGLALAWTLSALPVAAEVVTAEVGVSGMT